jgi:hypothetical protein
MIIIQGICECKEIVPFAGKKHKDYQPVDSLFKIANLMEIANPIPF